MNKEYIDLTGPFQSYVKAHPVLDKLGDLPYLGGIFIAVLLLCFTNKTYEKYKRLK